MERFFLRIKHEVWVLRGKRIAAWGLAFKPGTDDVRFAPALTVLERLLAEGARVSAYDPQAMREAQAALPELQCASSPEAGAATAARTTMTVAARIEGASIASTDPGQSNLII